MGSPPRGPRFEAQALGTPSSGQLAKATLAEQKYQEWKARSAPSAQSTPSVVDTEMLLFRRAAAQAAALSSARSSDAA